VPLSTERAASQVTNCINVLNTLLDDESKRAAPYPCLLYVVSTQIYIIVSKLALSLEDAQVVVASTRFFNILVHGEAEGVLDSKIFARSLIELVRKTTAQIPRTSLHIDQDELSEQDIGHLIELLFSVTTKIRLDPDILPAWFYPERDQPEGQNVTSSELAFAGATRKNAFPLFYLLIQYVYHDGQMGDFARTGLLFLTETASKSKSLEKWMIESDLATIMASGLGALYSRLAARLPQLEGDEDLPPILALSDFTPSSSPSGLSPFDFQNDLDAFLTYLKFWQDTLDHCASTEVAETLLDHFQVLFLQQLLYPSLLESSDVEGGSTASVITYLYRILVSLDHPALVQRTLHYLLGHKRGPLLEDSSSRRRSRMSLSRRKSLDHLTALAEAQENLSPALFNVRDLIVMSLKSKQSQTTTATLKLLSVILQRHHFHVRTSLFAVGTIPEDAPLWKLSTLNSQMGIFFAYASDIARDVDLNESYENVANDVSFLLGSHNCSLQPGETDSGAPLGSKKYSIAQSCVLQKEMSELLRRFFANQTTTNLALTESIISLACCRLISINGWFIPMTQTGNLTEEEPFSICVIIESLVQQIRRWRSSFEDWDDLLAAQKRRLLDEKDEKPEGPRLDSKPTDRIPVDGDARGRRGRALRSEIFGSTDGSLSPSPAPKASVSPDSLTASPFSLDVDRQAGNASSWCAAPASSVLQRRVLLPQFNIGNAEAPTHQQSHNDPEDTTLAATEQTHERTATLGHILINAVILQEFILEVAAVVQIRASLFEEVAFE
jgi:Retinoic acid induced 16-like protein/Family of unknown function (DUF5917)